MNNSKEYIEKCVNACDGLPDGALDGGWTARAMIDYAKKLEEEKSSIEFAEYMAKAAEQYMSEVEDCWDLGDALTESMLDELKDKTVALQRSIYEFRKRVPNAVLSGKLL